MLQTPTKFTVVAASAEGKNRLNAFDNALLASGIGNLNLLKVSSILPPAATEFDHVGLPPGSLMPTAYGTIQSDRAGERIAAAVGVGIGAHDEYGLIMEFSGRCSAEEAHEAIRRMLEEGFAARDRELKRTIIRSTEHTVVEIGCAFAAVALWY